LLCKKKGKRGKRKKKIKNKKEEKNLKIFNIAWFVVSNF